MLRCSIVGWKEWLVEKAADFLYNLFKKKAGLTASTDEEKTKEKNIRDVIQSEGDFVLSRSTIQDFNTKSVLQVMPGEEAVFINNGKIAGTFPKGRYVLDTSNIPFLSDVLAMPAGGKRIYSNRIYFVRKAVSHPIDWGTSVQVRDPVQLIFTRIMCHGSYKIRISDGSTFVECFVGNGIDQLDHHEFSCLLKDEILQTIKACLTNYIGTENKEILGIAGKQEILSGKIFKKIQNKFIQYGIEIITFSIAALDIFEDENRIEVERAYRNKRVQEL